MAGFKAMPKLLKKTTLSNGSEVLISEYAEYFIDEYLDRKGFQGKLSFLQIIVQMIEVIQELHKSGYVHQDIKPENFRIMNNTVVLLDFSIAKGYINDNGSHRPIWRLGFLGSPFYGSVKAYQGYSLSRRDDLSSVGFTILQMIDPEIFKVPWAFL
jgi:serine/threonine protein kinase